MSVEHSLPGERFIWNVEERTLSIDDAIRRAGKALGIGAASTTRLIEGRRRLAHPLRSMRRRRMARELAGGPYSGLISRQTGFARLPPEFPGLGAAVSASRKVLAAWEASAPDMRKWVRYEKNGRPNPIVDILTEEDLRAYPELLEFGLSRPIVEAVATHMGQVPRLLQVGVRVTPARPPTAGDGAPTGSRAFHLDGGPAGVNRVKCFVNLDDVNHDNGPFTFVSMAATWRIAAEMRDRWWEEPGPTDDDVLPRCAPGDISELTGPAGTAVLINSGRCLHFGNRALSGRRAIFQLDYTAMPDARPRFNTLARPGPALSDLSRFVRPGDDTLRRLLLDQRGW